MLRVARGLSVKWPHYLRRMQSRPSGQFILNILQFYLWNPCHFQQRLVKRYATVGDKLEREPFHNASSPHRQQDADGRTTWRHVAMSTGDRPAADSDSQWSDCDSKQLKELMQLRGAEAHEEIRIRYDGVTGLCSRLKTHPTQGKLITSHQKQITANIRITTVSK